MGSEREKKKVRECGCVVRLCFVNVPLRAFPPIFHYVGVIVRFPIHIPYTLRA